MTEVSDMAGISGMAGMSITTSRDRTGGTLLENVGVVSGEAEVGISAQTIQEGFRNSVHVSSTASSATAIEAETIESALEVDSNEGHRVDFTVSREKAEKQAGEGEGGIGVEGDEGQKGGRGGTGGFKSAGGGAGGVGEEGDVDDEVIASGVVPVTNADSEEGTGKDRGEDRGE
jgi:hypothetical protein